MQAALLWYEAFSICLKANGFELNKYESCIANKIINGKQCTICWHVNDTKISHKDPEVVSSVIKMLEDRFGELTVVRGNKHVFVDSHSGALAPCRARGATRADNCSSRFWRAPLALSRAACRRTPRLRHPRWPLLGRLPSGRLPGCTFA